MRPKFEKRVITLPTELSRESAIQLLRNVPIDPLRPLSITIEEAKRARGLDANGYYFMRLGEISKNGWFAGKQYSTEIWHSYCKRHILSEQITTKDGEVRSKWIEAPDGSLEVISTTLIEKTCFAQYTTEVEAFGASLGVQFSSNRSEH